MGKIKIGINGFGRIGRLILKYAIQDENIEITVINDIVSPEYIAYMFQYDSVHGKCNDLIQLEGNKLKINNNVIVLYQQNDPNKLNWKKHNIKYVIDSTGLFLDYKNAYTHIKSGAEKVIISAPPKDKNIPMFVMGVNHKKLKIDQNIVSTASCTTNCLAPIVKVLHENFTICKGLMTTIHASTATQKVVDSISIRDWRGGRSALVNIIPTSTGAAKAVGEVIPDLKNKLTGMSFRVPVADVSVVDLTVLLKKSITYNDIKEKMKHASQNELKGILGYTEDEVVSMDFLGDKRTSIFDANAGIMLDKNFFKIVSWYDNEVGYSSKLIDFIKYMSSIY